MSLVLDIAKYERALPDRMDGIPWWRWDGGWYEEDGENTRICVWPLDESSIVFDVGGGSGIWVRRMIDEYACTVHSFEPSPHFYEKMRQHVGSPVQFHPHPFGLGAVTRTLPLSDYVRDGASFLKEHVQPVIQAEVKDVAEVVQSLGVEHIDLMAINIEGWEYELIPHLIETGLTDMIERLMIQWHTFNDLKYMRLQYGIQWALSEIYEMIWNHSAWEAWEK